MHSNLLHSKSTDLNINHIFKNTITATPRLVFDRTTGNHSITKMAHKTTHHDSPQGSASALVWAVEKQSLLPGIWARKDTRAENPGQEAHGSKGGQEARHCGVSTLGSQLSAMQTWQAQPNGQGPCRTSGDAKKLWNVDLRMKWCKRCWVHFGSPFT